MKQSVMKWLLAVLGLLALGAPQGAAAQNNPSNFGGQFNAWAFAYGVAPNVAPLTVDIGSNSTGSYTVTLASGQITLNDGTKVNPLAVYAPVTIGVGATAETVTPSAVSCSTPTIVDTCTFTATFTYAHNTGDRVTSGSFGLQEALNYASGLGGGTAVVDRNWTRGGGSDTQIDAAIVVAGTSITDTRAWTPNYWIPGAKATTLVPAPAILTALTMLPSTTPAGSYGTGTYHGCIAYVDVMGAEGPCSADFSEAGLASGSFIFSAPAASSGVVGYTIYISLTSGTYTLAYKVPLTSTICTLTTLETTTAACAVTNATYGQTGATATVTAITVNTSPTALNSGVISTTAITHGNAGAHTTYGYTHTSGMGTSSIQGTVWPYPTSAAAATTVPSALGTVSIPANYMNHVGRRLRVCGYGTSSGASAATVLELSLQWDSFGQNTAGLPVTIADTKVTPDVAFAGSVVNVSFCFIVATQVQGTSATAGTIAPLYADVVWGNTAPGVSPSAATLITTAAVGSLNLASEARLHIVYTHVTGTDGAGFSLRGVTVEAL